MSFDKDQFRELLFQTLSLKNKALFDKIRPYMNLLGEQSLGDLLYDIASYGIDNNIDINTTKEILRDIYIHREASEYNTSPSLFYLMVKTLAYFSRKDEPSDIYKDYVIEFNKNNESEIDFVDISNFATYIYSLIEKKNLKEALKCIEVIKNAKSRILERYLIDYLIIPNLSLHLHALLYDNKKMEEAAQEIMDVVNNEKYNKHKSRIIKEKELDIIKANAEHVLTPKTQINRTPITVEKKVGRNVQVKVRYTDGRIASAKYKKLESDIDNKLCIIIEVLG